MYDKTTDPVKEHCGRVGDVVWNTLPSTKQQANRRKCYFMHGAKKPCRLRNKIGFKQFFKQFYRKEHDKWQRVSDDEQKRALITSYAKSIVFRERQVTSPLGTAYSGFPHPINCHKKSTIKRLIKLHKKAGGTISKDGDHFQGDNFTLPYSKQEVERLIQQCTSQNKNHIADFNAAVDAKVDEILPLVTDTSMTDTLAYLQQLTAATAPSVAPATADSISIGPATTTSGPAATTGPSSIDDIHYDYAFGNDADDADDEDAGILEGLENDLNDADRQIIEKELDNAEPLSPGELDARIAELEGVDDSSPPDDRSFVNSTEV